MASPPAPGGASGSGQPRGAPKRRRADGEATGRRTIPGGPCGEGGGPRGHPGVRAGDQVAPEG
eukprot:CAMPEP_0182903816 /NCGR_PEP_ID=MMETSP0034_2-20130328/31622_1 /TAXON_ID=156128 /ORGANISM="Nephroselmis pyriformis, Strain CCMP717" /LENGTH=62 /DNA_ID=CAMNT_0025038823 /DNA_START=57 /DNA_END=241 /DNA_ORIENTATION=-